MSWVAAATVAAGAIGAGAAKSDRDAAAGQSKQAREAIESGVTGARRDIEQIFPMAQQARLQGAQGAQDIFGQAVPQQFGAFQQGIGQAQQTASAAPQQQINALLGLGTDLSFLQPQEQFQPDFGFLNQPLPEQSTLEQSPQSIQADANAEFSSETIQSILQSGLFPELTNKVTRALGDVGQIRPGEFQQFLADSPRVGNFFRGEAMNISRRKGILPEQQSQGFQDPLQPRPGFDFGGLF